MSVLVFVALVFFFKQKTAYEMRISDWSSDVCSSDLQPAKGLLAGFESQNKAPRAYALACHDAEQSAIRADINEAVPFFQPLHLVGDDIVIGAKDAMAIGSVAWIQPKLDRTIMRPHRGAPEQRLHPLQQPPLAPAAGQAMSIGVEDPPETRLHLDHSHSPTPTYT